MFSLGVAKLAINVVSALGVAKVVDGVIKNNVTIVTTAEKVLVNAGSLVISSMVVQHSSEFVNEKFDEIANWRKKEEVKDAVETVKEKVESVAPGTEEPKAKPL